MSNFLTRTITGAIYVALMLLGVLVSYWVLALLMVFFAVAGVWEYSTFFRFTKNQSLALSIGAGVLITMASLYFKFGSNTLGAIVIAVFLLVPLLVALLKGQTIVAFSALGYIALPLTIMMALRGGIINTVDSNRWIILGMLVILWVNDTGAYLVGKAIGKHQMAPVTSPKKTWEGLFGGFFIAGLATWVLSLVLEQLNLTQWLIIFAVTVTFGTLGDLFESAIKRKVGVKDSGNLLPGHGGALDRIDSLLLALPFVFAVLVNIFAA